MNLLTLSSILLLLPFTLSHPLPAGPPPCALNPSGYFCTATSLPASSTPSPPTLSPNRRTIPIPPPTTPHIHPAPDTSASKKPPPPKPKPKHGGPAFPGNDHKVWNPFRPVPVVPHQFNKTSPSRAGSGYSPLDPENSELSRANEGLGRNGAFGFRPPRRRGRRGWLF